ncbi:MAG TPA: DUF3105 domain-containing protein [Solirubrobacteraceae bacterium]|nr:DUF3105 domain-containing protein [Solirubrobacteraceae bacterium]
MSSRQEEKERRRQERLAREQAEAKSAANRKRLQLAGGALLGLAAIAAVVVALVIGLGGDEETTAGKGEATDAAAAAKLPAQETSDLDEAVKTAGCTLTHAEYEGAGHEEKDFAPSDYKTNPPTSGTHFPEWYEDGVYAPGTVPNLGMLVHTLEHGRINVQYKKGTPAADVARLESLLQEQNEGYHMLLYENTTNMDAQVAATAWTQSLTCPAMNDAVFDALRTFRARYTDKGPESVP